MATRRDRRRNKALEKKKKNRAKAQAARSARTQRTQKRASPAKAARWPVGDCYISERWYEWEAEVLASFARVHDDGTVAAAVFEVDLAQEGLRRVELHTGLTQDQYHGLVADRAGDDILISTEPSHVAQLAVEGARFGERNGYKLPGGHRDLIALLGDIDPLESPHDVRFGEEGEDDATEEIAPATGILSRVKGWFSGS